MILLLCSQRRYQSTLILFSMREPKPVLVDLRKIGRKGGKNSRKNLSADERKELAQRAARARWDKAKQGKR